MMKKKKNNNKLNAIPVCFLSSLFRHPVTFLGELLYSDPFSCHFFYFGNAD